jgi:hypothetical protein
MYGVCVPRPLNEKLQESEITEIFSKVDYLTNFRCDIPYSGDDVADIHLGIQLQSTDDDVRSQKLIKDATKEQKEIYKRNIKIFKKQFEEAWEEVQQEVSYSVKECNLVKEFLKLLDQPPEVYRAYSTS